MLVLEHDRNHVDGVATQTVVLHHLYHLLAVNAVGLGGNADVAKWYV